jgi:hypothetical protein
MKKVIRARIAADLLRKVRDAEGWTWVEGENRTARVKALYDFGIDYRKGVYTATRKTNG